MNEALGGLTSAINWAEPTSFTSFRLSRKFSVALEISVEKVKIIGKKKKVSCPLSNIFTIFIVLKLGEGKKRRYTIIPLDVHIIWKERRRRRKRKGKRKIEGKAEETKLEDGQRLVWTVSRKYVRIAYTVNKQEKIDRGEHLLNIRAAMTGVEDISRPGRLINYARHKRTTITGRHVRATSPLSHRSYNNHTLFVRLHADARVRPRALKKIERASWDQTTPCTRRDGDPM